MAHKFFGVCYSLPLVDDGFGASAFSARAYRANRVVIFDGTMTVEDHQRLHELGQW